MEYQVGNLTRGLKSGWRQGDSARVGLPDAVTGMQPGMRPAEDEPLLPRGDSRLADRPLVRGRGLMLVVRRAPLGEREIRRLLKSNPMPWTFHASTTEDIAVVLDANLQAVAADLTESAAERTVGRAYAMMRRKERR